MKVHVYPTKEANNILLFLPEEVGNLLPVVLENIPTEDLQAAAEEVLGTIKARTVPFPGLQ